MSVPLLAQVELIDRYTLPLGDWAKSFVDWANVNLSWLWSAIRWPIAQTLDAVEGILQWLPWYVVVLAVGLIAWRLQGWKSALVFMGMMVFMGFLAVDIWRFAMTTLGMIVTAVIICSVIGIPLGIWAARNDKVWATIRPVLDAMQTIHPFIYLIPVVFFFSIGKVPGTIATVIFSLPPIVRLTNLGIRQVPKETVEAAVAFGSTDRQTLWEVQLPLARPAIMAGLNQTLMLALSMVVIVAIIGGGGLGQQIFRAVGRLDVPLATNAGLAVLVLAILLDRLSQTQRKQAARVE